MTLMMAQLNLVVPAGDGSENMLESWKWTTWCKWKATIISFITYTLHEFSYKLAKGLP